jgi:diacylglycerol kinase family enzyme
MDPLTLVLNPNARRLRQTAPTISELQDSLAPGSEIHLTRDLDELDKLMQDKRPDAERQTLCFYGGDGSIARGLTSLIRHHGEDCRIPPVLVVRAGTINMLASVLGLHESVDRTLRRWNDGELRYLREIPLIKVEFGEEDPHYGFVFAWGAGFRVLRKYYARRSNPTAWDAAWIIAKDFSRDMMKGDSTLFACENIGLKIGDAPPLDLPLSSLAAGTIPRVSLGAKPFPPEPVLPGGFHYSANGMCASSILRHLPKLLLGFGDQRDIAKDGKTALVAGTQVSQIEAQISDGFTIDGEMFEIARKMAVKISSGPVVRFWTNTATPSTLEGKGDLT